MYLRGKYFIINLKQCNLDVKPNNIEDTGQYCMATMEAFYH